VKHKGGKGQQNIKREKEKTREKIKGKMGMYSQLHVQHNQYHNTNPSLPSPTP